MDNIHFLLEYLHRSTQIPLHYYSQTNDLILFSKGFKEEEDPLVCDPELKKELLNVKSKNNYPVIKQENESFCYASFRDRFGCAVIAGPICANKDYLSLLPQYAEQHGIRSQTFTMKVKSVNSFLSFVILSYYCICGVTIDQTDLIATDETADQSENQLEYDYEQHILSIAENNFERMTITDERHFFQSIVDGDVEKTKQYFKDFNLEEKIPRLAKGHMKHYEYMLCTAITLAARYAIKGGVDPIQAYSLSDIYHHYLENCKTLNEYLNLHQDMMIAFALRVKQAKENPVKNSLVEKAKSYINSHVSSNFTLEDIAAALFVNSSYLSRLFTKTEGMGISAYTKKRKVETAKNMLQLSDTRLDDIAQYLCFATQSHFSKVFKEETGMTPLQYRNQHKVTDTTF